MTYYLATAEVVSQVEKEVEKYVITHNNFWT